MKRTLRERILSMLLAVLYILTLIPSNIWAVTVGEDPVEPEQTPQSNTFYEEEIYEPVLAAPAVGAGPDAAFFANYEEQIRIAAATQDVLQAANNTVYTLSDAPLKLTGTASDVTVQIVDGETPAFLVLEDAHLTGKLCLSGRVTRPICIISSGTANAWNGVSGGAAAALSGCDVYITGGANLTLTGSTGAAGSAGAGLQSDEKTGANGGDGTNGEAALDAASLTVSMTGILKLIGGNGGQGGAGANSTANGSAGADRNWIWESSGDGDNGGAGGAGGKGGDGAKAISDDTAVNILAGTCYLIGGKGGNGGAGGKGANGGRGGNNTAWGGDTGDGGDGGAGGKGGNAGATASNTQLQGVTLEAGAALYIADSGIASPGNGGGGGTKGKAGSANNMCGAGGQNGDDGAPGDIGHIFIRDAQAPMAIAYTQLQQFNLYPMSLTWPQAAAAAQAPECLVSIGSQQEQIWVQNLMQAADVGYAWIGVETLQIQNGQYDSNGNLTDGEIFQRWTDGTLVKLVKENGSVTGAYRVDADGNVLGESYQNWNAGEPNDLGGEPYGVSYSSGFWNDAASTQTNPYITEQTQHLAVVSYVTSDGTCVATRQYRLQENADYSFAVEPLYGYTTEEQTLSGYMGTEDIALKVHCAEKYIYAKVHYLAIDGTAIAYPATQAIYSQDGVVGIPSPYVSGYILVDEAQSDLEVSWSDLENGSVLEYQVYYRTTDQMAYTVRAMLGGQPLAGVSVTFNGETKTTNISGNAVFTYTQSDVTAGISLQVTADGYYCQYNRPVENFALDPEGITYVNMLIDTADDPNYSVVGQVCFGKSISDNHAYINTKYIGNIPITAQLNATGAKILKACLVQDQHVLDAQGNLVYEDDEGGNRVPRKVPVILQTVEMGSANLGEDGLCTFSVPASMFYYSELSDCPVYVYMYVENGWKPVIGKLNVTVIQQTFSLSMDGLFQGMSVEIQGTGIPMLDGLKISLESPMEALPVQVTAANDEIYVGVNIDCKDFFLDKLTQDKLTEKTDLLQLFTENSKAQVEEKFSVSMIDRKSSPGGASVTFDSELAGGITVRFNENGVRDVYATLQLKLETNCSWTTDFWILSIPLTITASVSGEGEVVISRLGWDVENQKLTIPSLSMKTVTTLGLSAGVGCRFASVGGAIRGTMELFLQLGSEEIFTAYIKLSASGGVYAKLSIGFLELKAEKMWKIKDKTIYLSKEPEGEATAMRYIGNYESVELYTLDAYALDAQMVAASLNTTAEETVDWDVGNAKVLGDVTEIADPKILQVGDGLLVVYFAQCAGTADDGTFRDFYDAKKLVYRYYDGTAWSEEQAVDGNQTADSEYSLYAHKGSIYLAYCDSHAAFDAETTADRSVTDNTVDLSSRMEVVTAKFDPASAQFVSFQRMTQDDYYDSLPTLGAVNGTLYLVWRQNRGTGDSVIFGDNTENFIMMSQLGANGTWTDAECLVNKCYPVTDLTVTGLTGSFGIAMTVDEDRNLYTADDRNLYFVDGNTDRIYVNRFGVELNGLQTGVQGGKEILVWYSDGRLRYMDSVTGEAAYLTPADETVSENYRFVTLSDHLTAVVWMESGVDAGNSIKTVDTMTEVYIRYCYDGVWQDTERLTYAAYDIMSLDLVVTDGEKLALAYVDSFVDARQAQDDGEGEYSDIVIYSKLCQETKTLPLSLNDTDTVETQNGTQQLVVEITNTGVYRVTAVDAFLKVKDDAKETDIGQYTVDLDPGETVKLVLNTSGKDLSEGYNLRIAIAKHYNLGGKLVTTDNYAMTGGNVILGPGNRPGTDTEYAFPDYTVSGEYIIIGEEEYISLRIDNVGDANATGSTLTVTRESDGTQVFQTEFEGLYVGNYRYYLIRLEKDFFAETNETFTCKVGWTFVLDMGYTGTLHTSVTVEARKLEGQAATEVDELVEAPILSAYHILYDRHTQGEVSVTIDPNGNDKTLRGDLDSGFVFRDADGLTEATATQSYLDSLPLGVHDVSFLYTTAAGYLMATMQLEVVDNTPIALTGTVTIVDTADETTALDTAQRGMMLTALVSGANTQTLHYNWIVDGETVSRETWFCVDNAYLGHTVTVEVTGEGVYYDVLLSQQVLLEKLDRELEAPLVTATEDPLVIDIRKDFYIGDGVVQYGYSLQNDPDSAVWSDSARLTLPEDGKYYIFTRVTGSDLYKDAVSTVTVYNTRGALPGDVNDDGQVDGKDSILLERYLAGFPLEINLENADVNDDGMVTEEDSILLNRYLTEWDVVLL